MFFVGPISLKMGLITSSVCDKLWFTSFWKFLLFAFLIQSHVLVLCATNTKDEEFGQETESAISNPCDSGNENTFRAYCEGETKETSTAEVVILEIVHKNCAEFGFSASGLSCLDGENGYRLSYSLNVDEANHVGCTISFPWAVVPQRGFPRICDPRSCISDLEDSLRCLRIDPTIVEIDVPKLTHESPIL